MQLKGLQTATIAYYHAEMDRLINEFTEQMMALCIDRLDSRIEPGEENCSYVYFFRMKGTNLIKIGKSNNPLKRLKQLQTGCGIELEVLHILKFKNPELAHKAEHMYHWYFGTFNDCRQRVNTGGRNKGRTEWFDVSDSTLTMTEKEIRALLYSTMFGINDVEERETMFKE